MPHNRSDVRVAALFAQAGNRAGLVERHFSIAGLGIRMRFAGEALHALLAASFEHLASPPSAAPGLTINVWDSASTGVEPPPLLGELLETDESGPVYYY